MDVFTLDSNLMVSQLIEQIIDPGQGVLVLYGYLIELSIIYTQSKGVILLFHK